jgi:hypothetical protein
MDAKKKPILPRLPEKGEYVRMQGILIDIRTIQPPAPKPITQYIFEERNARKELRLKDGSILNTLEELNDFYGLGSGEQTAILEMKEYAKKHGFDKDSDVEAFVVRVITKHASKPTNTENFYDKSFVDFEYLTHGIPMETKEIDVWSSKRGYLLDNKREDRSQ